MRYTQTFPCTSFHSPLKKQQPAHVFSGAIWDPYRKVGEVLKPTGKGFGHFHGDDPEPGEVRLVSDEYGDDAWVRMLAQLFDAPFDVAEG